MSFELPKLPYAMDGLAPYISQETLTYHYGKHHKAYVDKLNAALPGTEFENMSLEDIICKSSGGVFNNAAQIWNHTFYWHCMKPKGGDEPQGELADLICKHFGDFKTFKEKFTQAGLTQFGSGWAWLAQDKNGNLEVFNTLNAETPMTQGKKALLTCDVWEHAYYLDTQNDRGQYMKNFWDIVNWDFVLDNLHKA